MPHSIRPSALGFAIFLLSSLLVGCGSLREHTKPATLTGESIGTQIVLTKSLKLSLPGGLGVDRVESGTTFQSAGVIESGRVFRPTKAVILVRTAGDLHEAYIVMRGNTVVAVYLPVQESVIETTAPTPVSFKDIP